MNILIVINRKFFEIWIYLRKMFILLLSNFNQKNSGKIKQIMLYFLDKLITILFITIC